MKSIRMLIAVSALALALAPNAIAQPAPLSEVVVRAPSRSEEDRVRSFVGELTTPGRRAALPRWGRELCPGVVGMGAQHARALNDRVARVALELGLDVGAPGCNANVVVYFVRDAEAFAQSLTGPRGLVSTRAGTSSEAVRSFVHTPRVVRWWHLSASVADGFEVERDDQSRIDTSRPQVMLDPNGDMSAPVVEGSPTTFADMARDMQAADEISNGARVRGAGRLRANVEENLARVVIIVDADRVGAIRFGALADYIAMIALAQINPDADVGTAPSILNLFTDTAGPKPDRLTPWDTAYLEGLYRSPVDARDAQQQETMIVRSMVRSDE